jgi:SAM-dependent methyltransferase
VRPPGRLLDIGAGTGRLLWLAKQAGWDVAGLELSPAMAAFAAERVGAPVTTADFLAAAPGPGEAGACDVVVLRHVLEHLPDPRLAMARIRALLKPGGHLLLEMPNVEGLAKQWVRFASRSGLHRRRFDPALVPGHCCEYSRRSLAALADRSGFRLVAWGTYSKKPLTDWLLNRIPVGTKARAILVRDAAP